ncbi:MAG: toxin-antitoxin system HicB family antitoxin [SAR202 cluster bacterium]|nr:toxin-antitoxin system HicB family antitoxin [SAR202 cluster bacterium]
MLKKASLDRKPLDYYLKLNYPFEVVVDPDQPNGAYVVVFPDLPNCFTQADSLEELPQMAREARELWIEVEYERGHDIPEPSYSEEYSGKFNVRVPTSLHRSLAEAAKKQDVSLNQYVVDILSRGDVQARIERRLDEIEARLDGVAPVKRSMVAESKAEYDVRPARKKARKSAG